MKDKHKNPAAIALGKLGGSVTSDAKAKAAVANGKKGGRPIRGITAMLHRNGGLWWLATYAGGTIPSLDFRTSTEAKRHAKSKGWAVRRAPDCDS